MRATLALLLLASIANAQVGSSHGASKLTRADWRYVYNALHSRDGKRIAALVDPKAGLLVRRAHLEDHASKRLTRKDIVAYFNRLAASHADPRGVGPLAYTSFALPKSMPKPNAQGRYFFDTGHFDGHEDDSYLRFTVKDGKIWLAEVTAWAEMGRMP